MSFFDRQGIPEDLLRTPIEAGNGNGNGNTEEDDDHKDSSDEDTASDPNVDDEFEADILALRQYSFITTSMEEPPLRCTGQCS